jgi:hypothetical protein
MKNFIFVTLLVSLNLSIFSLNRDTSEDFIQAVIEQSDNLDNFVSEVELNKSNRLGIQYKNVKHKWLISYELESSLKDFTFQIETLKDDYSKLILTDSITNKTNEYFFHKDKFISPLSYHTKDWQIQQTEFIDFYLSDTNFFHQESADSLNSFVRKTAEKLNFSNEQITSLRENKINYIYCIDTAEIKKITGYNARGMLNLASDTVISTFSCHYHELVHLLVNFKLRELEVYTHPFLLEGLAVALGGRGGKEPKIIKDMGYFLESTGFLSYKDILTVAGFYSNDASLSYPVSGLYVSFLLQELGADKFLNLYRKYSSDKPVTTNIRLKDLPAEEVWSEFMKQYSSMNEIEFRYQFESEIVFENENLQISESEFMLEFQTNEDKINIYIESPASEYISKKFIELFPKEKYTGAKFLITIDDNEINIYNLYTNNLVAHYVSGFSLSQEVIPKVNEKFSFSVKKEVFGNFFNRFRVE